MNLLTQILQRNVLQSAQGLFRDREVVVHPGVLLHTVGARSGRERVNPMMYQDLGHGRVAIFATKAGAPRHPDWYHNLVANRCVTAEIGTETRRFRAHTATNREREPIWGKQKQDYPGFADYETKSDREIPVVILDPA
jgi:deazaflavin-dependent oxidoreductase (nitroreductase family)